VSVITGGACSGNLMNKDNSKTSKKKKDLAAEKATVSSASKIAGMSILIKFLLVILALLVAAAIALSVPFLTNMQSMVRKEGAIRLETLATNIGKTSKETILAWDYPQLKEICIDVLELEDIAYLRIYDAYGRLIGDSDYTRVGLEEPELMEEIENHDYSQQIEFTGKSSDIYYMLLTKFKGKEAMEVRVKLLEQGVAIGYLVCVSSLDRVNQVVAKIKAQILFITIGIVAVGILVAFFFVRALTRPIKLLQAGAEKIAAGDMLHRISVKTKDEIGVLGAAFNNMAAKLIDAIQKVEKQNMQLKEMDRLKSEFLANTSHELRTPLNGIIGLVESVLDGADGAVNAEQERHLQMVRKCSVSLLELVNNLLDLSKLEAGLMEFDVSKFILNDVLDTVIPIAEGLVRDKPDVEVKVEVL